MASAAAAAPAKRPTRIIRPKTKNNQEDKAATSVVSTIEIPVLMPVPVPEPEPVPETVPETVPEPYCDPSLFVKRQIRRTLSVPFYKITKSTIVVHLLRTELAKMVEGRCSIEGYICPNSVSISSYSCGTLAAANIIFDIIADCMVCYPDENTVIKCIARTITHAGIRAGARHLASGHVSPIEVFLSRDMHNASSSCELFSRIEENDVLTVNIIGRRFVLHDTHVTIIAMLMDAENP
jgi:hypothetical protein